MVHRRKRSETMSEDCFIDVDDICKALKGRTLESGLKIRNCGQCDQIKIAKCLWMFAKNGFTRKMNDFDTFPKFA